jgi:hypothetical protein
MFDIHKLCVICESQLLIEMGNICKYQLNRVGLMCYTSPTLFNQNTLFN